MANQAIRPIRAAFWWDSVGNTFENVVREFLGKAKAADLRETGHDCGHEFTIVITSRGHSSGMVGDPSSPHNDANYTSTNRPVTVRAHNLRDALLLAAAEPLSVWFDAEEDE